MFLLTALGLWIPAVYTLLFVLVCAVTGNSFSSALGIYYVGLCLSCIAALGLAVRQVLKAKTNKANGKRASTENISKVELKEQPRNVAPEANAPQPQPQPYPPQPQQYAPQPQPQPYVQPQQYAQPQPYQQGFDNGYNQGYQQGYNNGYGNGAQPAQQYTGGFNGGYSAPQSAYEKAAEEQRSSSFQGYFNSSNAYSGSNAYGGGYTSQPSGAMNYNTPIVYRTKSDPNVIIHEFSDRLVFYRRTLNGLEHEYTEPKSSSGNNNGQ